MGVAEYCTDGRMRVRRDRVPLDMNVDIVSKDFMSGDLMQ